MKMKLSPPFKEFYFSLNRGIILFDTETDSNDLSEFKDDYFKSKMLSTFGNTDCLVIGYLRPEYPLFFDPTSKAVFTLDPDYSIEKLAKVATSIKELYRLLVSIKAMHMEYGINDIINKSEESIEKYKVIMSNFRKSSPDCFKLFWIQRCFGELTIGLEI